jgi:hypothetical protein
VPRFALLLVGLLAASGCDSPAPHLTHELHDLELGPPRELESRELGFAVMDRGRGSTAVFDGQRFFALWADSRLAFGHPVWNSIYIDHEIYSASLAISGEVAPVAGLRLPLDWPRSDRSYSPEEITGACDGTSTA